MELRRISERQLAEKTGISQATLSRIISGDRTAKMPELILIAKELGCPFSYMTGSELSQRIPSTAYTNKDSDTRTIHQRLLFLMEIDTLLSNLGFEDTRQPLQNKASAAPL